MIAGPARLLIVGIALAGAASCGGSGDTSPPVPTGSNKTVDVYTIEQTFSSDLVTISVGDTIRWNFNKAQDGLGHNVRFSPRPAGTPADIGTAANPETSGTVSRVFTTKGTFNYVCDLHGGMTGEVIVQ
jgi:plastocyanin